MSGRRSVIGLFVLCALAFSAFSAASASAEQRAFMCEQNVEESGGEQFSDPHCTNPATGNSGYKHVPIEKAFAAAFVASNAKTAKETTAAAPSKLTGTLAGVATEIECSTVGGEGSLTNAESSVSGTGTLKYSGCAVNKPVGKGCVVTGGGFTTETLAATTLGQAANTIKFSPKTGTTFAAVTLSKCSIEALNGKFSASGSVSANANGATVTTTEEGITKQGTLTLGGNTAGLEGAITVSTPLGLFAFTLT